MNVFDRHPPQVKRAIALVATGVVAVVLVVLLVIFYTKQRPSESGESKAKLRSFYNTISNLGQSQPAEK